MYVILFSYDLSRSLKISKLRIWFLTCPRKTHYVVYPVLQVAKHSVAIQVAMRIFHIHLPINETLNEKNI